MADTSNTALWDRAFTTHTSAVKPITGKQYKGNSPKPYWIVQRLTEELGPCGHGWGMQIVQERFERLTDTDVLHVATVRLWYVLDGKRGELEQMGQTKACYKTSSGSMLIDEDAPKKSVTDALVKCASYLGFAGDIFSGRWDDSKYVEHLKQEERQGAAVKPLAETKKHGITQKQKADLLAALDSCESLEALEHLRGRARTACEQANDPEAYNAWKAEASKRAAQLKAQQ